MEIEEIPANEIVVMTEFWHRAFNAVGCNPKCHSCYKLLPSGTKFKLSTVKKLPYKWSNTYRTLDASVEILDEKGKEETKEVMLCEDCSPTHYHNITDKLLRSNAKKAKETYEKHLKLGGGCFRVNGKIVI